MADYETIDPFDRVVGALEGAQSVTKTRPTTITTHTKLVGAAQTFTVQTYRERIEKDGGRVVTEDTILITYIDAGGGRRLVIPSKVADAIAQQRDALTTKARKRAARAAVETRKERGIVSTFGRKAVNQ